MHEGVDQIANGCFGSSCLRAVPRKRNEHRMPRLARIHGVEQPRHQASSRRAFGLIADLVAKIVSPAAERIDVVEVLVQPLWEQEADDVEVLVVVGRQPARVLLRPRDASTSRLSASCERTKSVRWR